MKKSLFGLMVFILLNGCSSPSPAPTLTEPALLPTQTPTTKSETQGWMDPSSLTVITVDNVKRVRKLGELLGHSEVVGVVFSPDGKTLASYALDGTTRLWDVSTGYEYRVFQRMSVLAYHPEGAFLASGGTDKTVLVWDVETGEETLVFEGHTAGIGWRSIDWSPDGKWIAAGSRNGGLLVWDAATGEEAATLEGHYSDLTGIRFSPDGTVLASSGEDDYILLWDVPTWMKKATLLGHQSDVGDVVFLDEGKILASISGDVTNTDNFIRFWDLDSGEEIGFIQAHEESYYCDLAIHPDGSILASSGGFVMDGKLRLYDARQRELIHELKSGAGGISSVDFSPDGTLIATGSADGVIEFWGVDS
ncbi:MAG: WD40 repeat domain-containing protein [Anaerolineales bacterium]